jgi:hypothetical protein
LIEVEGDLSQGATIIDTPGLAPGDLREVANVPPFLLHSPAADGRLFLDDLESEILISKTSGATFPSNSNVNNFQFWNRMTDRTSRASHPDFDIFPILLKSRL